jgi:hypothetical protein
MNFEHTRERPVRGEVKDSRFNTRHLPEGALNLVTETAFSESSLLLLLFPTRSLVFHPPGLDPNRENVRVAGYGTPLFSPLGE